VLEALEAANRSGIHLHPDCALQIQPASEKRTRLARCEAKMLALEFDYCAEVDGYQPAPDCLVGVEDTAPLTEVNVVRIADDDALVVDCNVSVISIEEEHLGGFAG